MTDIKKSLSIGEVASRSGINISALHFYESKGLIKSSRNNGNHRRYARSILRKIAVIKAAQRAGIPLKEIAEALSTLPSDDRISSADWERLSTRWKEELDDKIARLTLLRDNMTYCIGCGCLSEKYCEMLNPGDQLATKGPGPHLLEPTSQKNPEQV